MLRPKETTATARAEGYRAQSVPETSFLHVRAAKW
jgi:hypothetical protein